MNQKIEEIIARFGREGWLVQKTKESFWALRPKGVYNYKVFLLTYNPFDDKFTIVKPPTPNDPHYQQAVKILETCDRDAIANCTIRRIAPQNKSFNSFDLRGNMASIFQISADTFLNFDDIRQLKTSINRSEFKVTVWWRGGEISNTFHDEQAKRVIQLVQLYALANINQLQLNSSED